MNPAISRLKKIGLSEYEAKAYTTLLRDNPLTAYEIAKKSGIPSSKVYEVVQRLESKHMAQSIHRERSKMYIPMSVDDFIDTFKRTMEDRLVEVKAELKEFTAETDASYTWHIKDYESLILKAKRMLDTCLGTVLLSLWPAEVNVLETSISDAETRGIKIALVHYGATNIKLGQLYRHPVEDTIYAQKGVRSFTLLADSKEVLTGNITGMQTEAMWSMNESFVMMAEDYIRHDIYAMKIVERFDPLLKEKFGSRYEKLRDVYSDEEIAS